jgi:hypothetical protein
MDPLAGIDVDQDGGPTMIELPDPVSDNAQKLGIVKFVVVSATDQLVIAVVLLFTIVIEPLPPVPQNCVDLILADKFSVVGALLDAVGITFNVTFGVDVDAIVKLDPMYPNPDVIVCPAANVNELDGGMTTIELPEPVIDKFQKV